MSQQRFEGATLEAVLAEVADRLGPGAAIVEANKLRRGGLAGFFAKERFEVLVEGAETGRDIDADPAVSTESADFAAVLDALINQAGADDEFIAWPTEILPTDDEVPAVPPPPPAPLTPAPTQETFVPAPAWAPPAAAEAAGSPLAEVTSAALVRPGASVPAGAAAIRPVAEAAVPAIAAPRGSRAELVRLGLPEELVRTGDPYADPARWIAGLLELAPRARRLPKGRGTVVASVGSRDDALALACDLSVEMGLDPAEIVLASPNYRGRAVAAHRRLPNVEAAGEQRRSWRRRPVPTVVAVDAAPGPAAGVDWGRRVLDILEPTMVWASVEATRKPEDISAWADRLGGLDALAVNNIDETESPAAVLHTGLPVGRLDGRPATPALWGALLAERLLAAPSSSDPTC